ncbi:MAG: YqhA family protein [Chloroflexota bacterium]|nr:MAG: YqhA family protein [Chloroflexota bacterium]
MERPLTQTKYIVLIGVIGLLVASIAGFALAAYETAGLVWYIFTHFADPDFQIEEVTFIKLVDGFLVSTGLLVFGLGLFEIFIRPLELPSALRFRTIGELKTTLASIIVLTLAVTFLTMVQEPIEDAMSILLKGLAIAAVILALVFFARNGEKEEH